MFKKNCFLRLNSANSEPVVLGAGDSNDSSDIVEYVDRVALSSVICSFFFVHE